MRHAFLAVAETGVAKWKLKTLLAGLGRKNFQNCGRFARRVKAVIFKIVLAFWLLRREGEALSF